MVRESVASFNNHVACWKSPKINRRESAKPMFSEIRPSSRYVSERPACQSYRFIYCPAFLMKHVFIRRRRLPLHCCAFERFANSSKFLRPISLPTYLLSPNLSLRPIDNWYLCQTTLHRPPVLCIPLSHFSSVSQFSQLNLFFSPSTALYIFKPCKTIHFWSSFIRIPPSLFLLVSNPNQLRLYHLLLRSPDQS